MKKLCILLILGLILGCKEKPKNPVAEYGDAMINSYKRGQAAGEELNLDAIKKSISFYHATHNKYPQNLSELEDLKYKSSTLNLSRYDYNPETGSVELKK